MDAAAFAARLEKIGGRTAGSDAERRAAALCAAQLRASGRRPRTTTLWVRPRREVPRALYAALGIAASVVAVGDPVVGLALAAAALLAATLDAAGLPLLALLQVRRATQNVVAAPPARQPGRVLFVITAAADAPRDALLARLERELRARLLPGAAGWLVIALAAVAACAGARVAGAEGALIGAVQLVPSVVLILLLGGYVDAALAGARAAGSGGGPAAALAAAAALDAQSLSALAVEVLIAGAGEAGALGMAAYVRSRRRELDAEDVVVLHLRGDEGPLRYVTHEGEHLPVRLHPRLTELAAALPGASPRVSRSRSAARVARGARWPAIALEGQPRALAAAALRLAAAVDREVALARPTAGRLRSPPDSVEA